MIKRLVFDLDGTLWKTEEAYLYAYHKLEEEYQLMSLTKEQIFSVLGIELSLVKELIFGQYDNKEELTQKALAYSIEYMKMHPTLCSTQIQKLFSSLNKSYEVYILSACPKAYLDTFLELSEISKYIKKGYSILDGSKEELLKQVSVNEKVIYVGDCPKDYDAIWDHTKIQFCYAKYGYFKLESYDYSIDCLDEILFLLDQIQIKEKMISPYPYEVISYKDSSLTVIYKENDLAYFGFLNIGRIDNFKEVLLKLKQKCKIVYGPFNGNTWYSYRISLNSFDFNLYPDCIGNEEMLAAFIEAGFHIYSTYSSTLSSINKRIWDRCRNFKIPLGIHFEIYHGQACYEHLEEIYEVALVAFQKGDFYEEISFECFKEIYLKNIELVQPDILCIYDENRLIAFNFCYEDLEKRFYVCKTTAILPEYQNKTILKLLIDKSYQMMIEKGYQEVLYHFQNDRTKVLNGIYKNHIIRQKKYGVLYYENKK